MVISSHCLIQAYKFDLFLTTYVSRLVGPMSFFPEFCHKAGYFEDFIEFLSIKIEFILGSIVFCMKMLWISGKMNFCKQIYFNFFLLSVKFVKSLSLSAELLSFFLEV